MTETIKGARWKSVLLLIGCLAFVALGVWLPYDGQTETVVWKWVIILFFGLGVPLAVYQLFHPASLTLDARGFTYVGVFNRQMVVAWDDVEAFKLFKPPRGPKMLVWNYRPGRGPRSALSGISRALGADAGLPGGLADSPARLLEKMSQRLAASRR
ncbi:hypothetical protein QO010_001508 [Caulobacter ginsengisoli]|uniref:PH domain-containing protein n=1 Tax=Caulobacter ginsengisoli TaxID=400775 RepID=A0ABU0IP02_9CAUL|nr:STM3941 family protein [Caulobacter ginsengisoli]MDQ0463737.1 hypothetical protein [Caulobacter ginsengisoli]